jgi:hypothetical protein
MQKKQLIKLHKAHMKIKGQVGFPKLFVHPAGLRPVVND